MVKLGICISWLSFASALGKALSADSPADGKPTKAMLRDPNDPNMGVVARVLYCKPDAYSEQEVYLHTRKVSIQDQEKLRFSGEEVSKEEAQNIKETFFGDISEWKEGDFVSEITIPRGDGKQAPILKVDGNTLKYMDGWVFSFRGNPGEAGRIRFLEQDADTTSIYEFFVYIYRSNENCPENAGSNSSLPAEIVPYNDQNAFLEAVKSSTAISESWGAVEYIFITVVGMMVCCCVVVVQDLVFHAISKKKERARAQKEEQANFSPRRRRKARAAFAE